MKLDFSGLKETLIAVNKQMFDELKESLKPSDPKGKGFIATGGSNADKILESLKKVTESNWQLTEQWTVTIPNYTTKETAAHLRDYVWITEILKGVAGDTAYIPYVGDLDFELLSSVGAAITTQTTGLVSNLSTTLYEAAAWTDIAYSDIEKYDSNLIAMLNQILAFAAFRAEDAKIMTLVDALTGTNFAGNVTRSTGSANFYATNIPAALKLLLATGKDVKPNDCVCYMTASAYGALLTELVASQIIADAIPSIINQGIIKQLYGVNLVVGGYRPYACRAAASTGTVELAYLMRAKRAVALAPKRDILIETDKQINARKLRFTASHTFGVKVLSGKEIVRIWTSKTY